MSDRHALGRNAYRECPIAEARATGRHSAVRKLMFAPVIRAAERGRGIQVGEFELRQLRTLRDELHRAHAQRVAPAVNRPTSPVVQRLRK